VASQLALNLLAALGRVQQRELSAEQPQPNLGDHSIQAEAGHAGLE
jgi:hypothetical protein